VAPEAAGFRPANAVAIALFILVVEIAGESIVAIIDFSPVIVFTSAGALLSENPFGVDGPLGSVVVYRPGRLSKMIAGGACVGVRDRLEQRGIDALRWILFAEEVLGKRRSTQNKRSRAGCFGCLVHDYRVTGHLRASAGVAHGLQVFGLSVDQAAGMTHALADFAAHLGRRARGYGLIARSGRVDLDSCDDRSRVVKRV